MPTQQTQKRVAHAPFRTAVWNLYNQTPIERSAKVLDESLAWGTQLFLVNEAMGRNRVKLFESRGLEVAQHFQFMVAWDPKRFRLIKQWHARLSDQQYFRKDGKTPVHSEGQAALLEDLQTGLTLEAWSYHTPAHVQKDQSAPGYPMRRYLSLIETMVYFAERAENTEADGFICGGDDNWDEDGPNDKGDGIQTKDVIPVLLGKETGLRQIQANEGTFASREIDDYRIRKVTLGGAVKPTGEIRVRDGGGAERPAHKIHEREWVMLAVPDEKPLLSVRRVARQVLSGRWGNGDERRTRLTEAGYDYEAVQVEVNRILAESEPEPPAPVETEHPCLACGVVHLGVITEPSR